MNATRDRVACRVHGSPALPTLIHLPGMHGDWTLISSFRQQFTDRARFVEISYARAATWSLEDYAKEVEQALFAADVREGWLIGESFGSQPAWVMLARAQQGQSQLKIHGLILAGGFVKHPWPWGARFLRFLTHNLPRVAVRIAVRGYAIYARFRHPQTPGTLASLDEFVANRLHPDDARAIELRCTLVAESDLRPAARACELPVFHLAGLVDPIVPALSVRRWLRNHCPGFRQSTIIRYADHNVLGTAPDASAQLIIRWMACGCAHAKAAQLSETVR